MMVFELQALLAGYDPTRVVVAYNQDAGVYYEINNAEIGIANGQLILTFCSDAASRRWDRNAVYIRDIRVKEDQ